MKKQIVELSNRTWDMGIANTTGNIVRLFNKKTKIEYVAKTDKYKNTIEEGGFNRSRGLSIWVKTGKERDYNTGVLSAFASVQNVERTFQKYKNSCQCFAETDEVKFIVEYTLPPDNDYINITTILIYKKNEPAYFQFECYYRWLIAPAKWSRIAYKVPGITPAKLAPYGELFYKAGSQTHGCAKWWEIGTNNGIAIKPINGVDKYFVGVQHPFFIMGPHGICKTLKKKNDTITMTYQIADIEFACTNNWFSKSEKKKIEIYLIDLTNKKIEKALSLGGIRKWCSHSKPAIRRRIIHLTTQYSPTGMENMYKFIQEIIVPAGFNEIVFEVGHNFRYRSHPNIHPRWGWEPAEWRRLVKRLKLCGLNIIPEYNALGHQSESGLARTYPELAEDPNGWCLNPENPKTIRYLGNIFDELLEVFESNEFHVGLDEVDVPSRPQTFALPKKGRKKTGGELFALHINNLHEHLSSRGVKMMMWADMLMYKPEHGSQNGLRTGTWKAIDAIPKDIIMVDWVYHKVPDFGGAKYLLKNGFQVIGASWHVPANISDWAIFAEKNKLLGMMHTTWALPSIKDVNMVCVLLAGKLFQNPYANKLSVLIKEAESLAFSVS